MTCHPLKFSFIIDVIVRTLFYDLRGRCDLMENQIKPSTLLSFFNFVKESNAN